MRRERGSVGVRIGRKPSPGRLGRVSAAVAAILVVVLVYQLAVGGIKVAAVNGGVVIDASGFGRWWTTTFQRNLSAKIPAGTRPSSSAALGSSTLAAPAPPVASYAWVDTPSPHDPLLTRRMSVSSVTGAHPIAGYEYGWVQVSRSPSSDLEPPRWLPTSPPVGQLVSTSGSPLRVSFAAASPDSLFMLYLRPYDTTGMRGPWTTVMPSPPAGYVHEDGRTEPRWPDPGPFPAPPLGGIRTPHRPMVVVLGDSVASGHHDEDGVPTTCWDPAYGYPSRVYQRLQAALPPAWRGTDTSPTALGHYSSNYVNYARSGFQTEDVLSIGGPSASQDSCGRSFLSYLQPSEVVASLPSTPMAYAANALRHNSGSWNIVVVTAGINDTSWVGVIKDVGCSQHWLCSFFGLRYSGSPDCTSTSAWTGWDLTVQRAISRRVGDIAGALAAADGDARINWLGYYIPSGTYSVRVGLQDVVLLPDFCLPAVQKMLAQMDHILLGSLASGASPGLGLLAIIQTGHARYSPATEGIGISPNNERLIQPWPGWPHPNQAGALAISNVVVTEIPLASPDLP